MNDFRIFLGSYLKNKTKYLLLHNEVQEKII